MRLTARAKAVNEYQEQRRQEEEAARACKKRSGSA